MAEPFAVFPSLPSGESEPLIDANKAAHILHVHPVTARQMASDGEIPALKIGRCWRFRESALQSWITRQLQGNQRKDAA